MPVVVRDIFEKEFCKRFGVADAIAVNSGTSALIAALWSLDLKPGDEVITTPFTFIATSNAILIAGAKPVFVDIDPESKLMDPELIEDAITENTKAIIPVHLYGRMCKMPRIMEIARKHDLMVIEDAAQAFGSSCDFDHESLQKPCISIADAAPQGHVCSGHRARRAGTIGDVGCFSFYKTKNFSTFEGGMITVPEGSQMDAAKIRSICDQGQVGKYNHEYIGFNFRLAEPLCLIGLENLKIHKRAWMSELGMRDESHGHYPNVVYEQPAYKQRGITGNCPNAEAAAKAIRER
jgi:dTDP-4-amino-4,6-dideoxygalactose transaminase